MDRHNRQRVIVYLLLPSVLLLVGCGGPSLSTHSLVECSAVLHVGETVVIHNVLTVGYCKHAWKCDDTGTLRNAVIVGDPTDYSGGSPYGMGIAYDYHRLNDTEVQTVLLPEFEIYLTHVYVHPDEGVHASEDIHRQSWIRIVWYE